MKFDFGFDIFKKDKKQDTPTPISPLDDEGSVSVNSAGFYGTYVDVDASVKTESELISRYRDISNDPDVDNAIEEIVSEIIAALDSEVPVKVDTSELELGDKVKKKIEKEFETILKLLQFKDKGHDICKRWYIDGRLNYQKVIDQGKKEEGIKKLVFIDPRKIKKMRKVTKEKLQSGLEVIKNIEEFYLYNDKGLNVSSNPAIPQNSTGIRISLDMVTYVHSGLYDYDKNMVLGYLHKAIKPVNQLKMMTDSMVIYRLARSPERRIFYIDIGNLPKNKAEEYMKSIMTKYRNKIIYDSSTGTVKDDRHHMTMMEDYWLPRRSDGRGTQIDTLRGAENLGAVEDINLLQNKVYSSLNVPPSRFQGQTNVLFGRQAEISRDEMKFAKFINRLRRKFNGLFDDLLKTNLILKKIIREDEWNEIKDKLNYKYTQDQYFQEVKEAEILRNRVDLLNQIQPYVGIYFSTEYVYKEVLRMSEEEMKELIEQIKKNPPPVMSDGQPGSMQAAALTKTTSSNTKN
jgi:hypothetical protein